MNIYTLPGKIVTCNQIFVGYEEDIRKAADFLEIGRKYTGLKTVVQKHDTLVYLEEISNVYFSPLHFINEVCQNVSEDMKHPDYRKQHTANTLK